METFFATGRVADLVLVVLAMEVVALALLRRATGRGPTLGAVLSLALPGAALVLALRVALTDGWWGWIGVWLAVALVAHLIDLRGRWRE